MPGDLFWEFYQQRGIVDAGAEAAQARSRANRAAQEVGELRMKVDRLSLACQALWELLRDDGVFDEERLMDKIQEVDLRDGRADGKIGPQAVDCPQCGRKSRAGRQRCMYCGTGLADGSEHVFE